MTMINITLDSDIGEIDFVVDCYTEDGRPFAELVSAKAGCYDVTSILSDTKIDEALDVAVDEYQYGFAE